MGDQALDQQALHVGAAGKGSALVLPELFVVGAHQLLQLADVAGLGVPQAEYGQFESASRTMPE